MKAITFFLTWLHPINRNEIIQPINSVSNSLTSTKIVDWNLFLGNGQITHKY